MISEDGGWNDASGQSGTVRIGDLSQLVKEEADRRFQSWDDIMATD
jgi:hypothetical protein